MPNFVMNRAKLSVKGLECVSWLGRSGTGVRSSENGDDPVPRNNFVQKQALVGPSILLARGLVFQSLVTSLLLTEIVFNDGSVM